MHPIRNQASNNWWRYLLVFGVILCFILLSFPGNRSEADDGFYYAYLVRDNSWERLFQSRYLLFLPFLKAAHTFFWQLGWHADVYKFMCYVSAACSAATCVLVYYTLNNVFNIKRTTAVWGAVLLMICYGFWRYAVEAEVYAISNLLSILVFLCMWRMTKERGSRKWLLITSVLAGVSVLFYKPNVIPLFFAFPFWLLIRRQWSFTFAYGILGFLVVLAGYYSVYSVFPGDMTFREFFLDGASQSYGSPLVTIFVIGANILATGFIYGFEKVAGFIHHRFPANIIAEEVYAANSNPVGNKIAVVTTILAVLSILATLILVFLKRKRLKLLTAQVILVLWIGIYAMMLLYLDPNSPEPWTMLLLPMVLLISSWVGQLPRDKWVFLPWAMLLCIGLHNFFGGYQVIRKQSGDLIVHETGWLEGHTSQGDLVMSLGAGSKLNYIAYNTPATVYSLEQHYDKAKLNIRNTLAGQKKVYILEDAIEIDPAVKFRHPEAYEKSMAIVAELKPYLILQNPGDPKFAPVYALDPTYLKILER
ncbi:hypothetical protein COR50_03570 [Chitinophaga caeni]|uniref:Glycosyltransferase RgtA/B/C/D-like domain-containing protein n=1 Tax=Chitinophaga caeni TaxID=2029983 RepID=A0A291QQW8_9BACT|nr:DUF2723 domain-containing protein [Chitinophaga caeni]ATL46326.1 hypothetical protein COR50_03570 [Chitinophaga caeni]